MRGSGPGVAGCPRVEGWKILPIYFSFSNPPHPVMTAPGSRPGPPSLYLAQLTGQPCVTLGSPGASLSLRFPIFRLGSFLTSSHRTLGNGLHVGKHF